MLIMTSPDDAKAERNVQILLDLYKGMFDDKKPLETALKYLTPDYIQHNPRLEDTAYGTGSSFQERLKTFPNMSVKVHRIIAKDDYVWAHVNFLNIYSNDPNDLGVAGVDIFRFSDDGLIVEHWDVLQVVPESKDSANGNGMFQLID